MTQITETPAPTDTITIDREQALALMKRAVEEKGEHYVYVLHEPGEDEDGYPLGPACVYVRDGEPSCIVGHALHYAGLTIDELAVLDAPTGTAARSIPEVIRRVNFTRGAREAFMGGQSAQDAGWYWGESLSAAERDSEGME